MDTIKQYIRKRVMETPYGWLLERKLDKKFGLKDIVSTPYQTIFLPFFAGAIYKEATNGTLIWLVAGAG